MFERLEAQAGDVIIGLMAAFRQDARPDKVDLGVGVYRDPVGATPVMQAIKSAERVLTEGQTTKTYTGMAGDLAAAEAFGALALGEARMANAARAQAVGGSGALFLLARLIHHTDPGATIHLPTPTWPNHPQILGEPGLTLSHYPYLDVETGDVDAAGMLAALNRLGPRDVVLLHGCCHNPTGADPSPELWAEIAASSAARGWTPLVDIAYQGLGAGLEEDAAGVRLLADAAPQLMLAMSASKIFGLYRDRAGAAVVLPGVGASRDNVQGVLEVISRHTYSMPPDHGGAAVHMILTDPALRAEWEDELTAMRTRINGLRTELAEAFAARQAPSRFQAVAQQRGLFSLLGLTDAQVTRLREEHGVYVVTGGRVNMAGLTEGGCARVAGAILGVLD